MDKLKAYKAGLRAEFFASLYLTFKGYKILARRYKTPVGEIDIVALRRGTLVFAEVKARDFLPDSLFAVDPRTQRRIERAAGHFLAFHPAYAGHAMRFDVIAFVPPFSFRHLDNAWQPRP